MSNIEDILNTSIYNQMMAIKPRVNNKVDLLGDNLAINNTDSKADWEDQQWESECKAAGYRNEAPKASYYPAKSSWELAQRIYETRSQHPSEFTTLKKVNAYVERHLDELRGLPEGEFELKAEELSNKFYEYSWIAGHGEDHSGKLVQITFSHIARALFWYYVQRHFNHLLISSDNHFENKALELAFDAATGSFMPKVPLLNEENLEKAEAMVEQEEPIDDKQHRYNEAQAKEYFYCMQTDSELTDDMKAGWTNIWKYIETNVDRDSTLAMNIRKAKKCAMLDSKVKYFTRQKWETKFDSFGNARSFLNTEHQVAEVSMYCIVMHILKQHCGDSEHQTNWFPNWQEVQNRLLAKWKMDSKTLKKVRQKVIDNNWSKSEAKRNLTPKQFNLLWEYESVVDAEYQCFANKQDSYNERRANQSEERIKAIKAKLANGEKLGNADRIFKSNHKEAFN